MNINYSFKNAEVNKRLSWAVQPQVVPSSKSHVKAKAPGGAANNKIAKRTQRIVLPPELVIVRFRPLISKPYRLFEFDHLADARLIAHLQPIQIDPGGDGLPLGIPTIPSQPMLASHQ